MFADRPVGETTLSMAEPDHVRRPISFVITAWLEPYQGAAGEWRYHVRHVQSGQESHFTHLEGVVSFLAQQTGVAPNWGKNVRKEQQEGL